MSESVYSHELHRETLGLVSEFIDNQPQHLDDRGETCIYRRQAAISYLMTLIAVVLEKDRKEQNEQNEQNEQRQTEASTITTSGRDSLHQTENPTG